MLPKIAIAAAAVALAALVLWHPVRPPALVAETPAPQAAFGNDDSTRPRRHARSRPIDDQLIVYVAGAVKRPGLYHLHAGDRNAQGVALAGGMSAGADAGAVNLAQRAADGDEIYVPAVGETHRSHSSSAHRGRRRSAQPLGEIVDVNRAGADELAAVPGVGRAIAQRIVELREREGNFSSLDELLDVAGMTQSRLERARPYLRQP
jgi:competence protein ComEA